MHHARFKKPYSRGCILYNSKYIIFWQRQDHRVGDRSLVVGLGSDGTWLQRSSMRNLFLGKERIMFPDCDGSDCCCLVAKSCPTLLWPYGHIRFIRLLCLWDFPGKNPGVGCHFLFQGIFLTQGSNPHFLQWQVVLYHWPTMEASGGDCMTLFIFHNT